VGSGAAQALRIRHRQLKPESTAGVTITATALGFPLNTRITAEVITEQYAFIIKSPLSLHDNSYIVILPSRNVKFCVVQISNIRYASIRSQG